MSFSCDGAQLFNIQILKHARCSGSGVGSVIEPLSAVPLNDKLQQARASVAKAEEDVLWDLTEKVCGCIHWYFVFLFILPIYAPCSQCPVIYTDASWSWWDWEDVEQCYSTWCGRCLLLLHSLLSSLLMFTCGTNVKEFSKP